MTNRKKNAYLIGIKGVAMTALAVYLKEKGWQVTGSDVSEVFYTDRILTANKIKILEGFKADNLNKNISLVVATGAHGGANNIESLEAQKLKLPFFMHGKYLGFIMDSKFGIAVAGCHGKTTTSSMIALMLTKAGLNPSYATGTAYINLLGPAGHFARSKYFIAEADEYMTCPQTDRTPRFHFLHPQIAVITNIEYDHPDEFKDLSAVKNAYIDFSAKLKENGLLIVCIDDPGIASILSKFKSKRIITYGFSPRADYRVEKFYTSQTHSFMNIVNKNLMIGQFMLKVPGRHNLLNALSAMIVCREVGMSWEGIKNELVKYTGVNRRFELIKEFNHTFLYDDYAHHPSEIKATLQAIKERFPGSQIVVIFQPHTYSRTKRLASEFASSFLNADLVFLADIFPSAREKFDPGISSKTLVAAINGIKNNAFYTPVVTSAIKIMKNKLSDNSVIFTMGAGNLYLWHRKLINFLKEI